MKKTKKIVKKVDNKMRSMGMYDEKTGIVKINKKMAKTANKHKRKKREVLDTIQHETLHVQHPRMTEKTVYKKTPKLLDKMTTKMKIRMYRSFPNK